jgi:hypothetical protein
MASFNTSRLENFLAYGAIGVTAVSLLAMITTLMMELGGVDERPVILAQLPLIGLPVGFMMILVMIIISFIRRTKENRD